jgi:dTMP kinase
MEMEGQDFHTKVSDAYLRIAEEHPERIVVIEADKQPDEVFEDVRLALEKALGEREDGADANRGTSVAAVEEETDLPEAPPPD